MVFPGPGCCRDQDVDDEGWTGHRKDMGWHTCLWVSVTLLSEHRAAGPAGRPDQEGASVRAMGQSRALGRGSLQGPRNVMVLQGS